MSDFIRLNAVDPFSNKEDAFNPIYVRPRNVAHVENFSGPFPLQAYGPDGRLTTTGKHRDVLCAGLLYLAVGGSRVVKETPDEVMELITDAEKSFG